MLPRRLVRSRPVRPGWSKSPERAALLALYAEADALLEGWSCACSRAGVGQVPEAQCCHFGVTGREPHPTAVELEEVRHGMRVASVAPRDPRKLPLAPELGACPLLGQGGRCGIYASRPFGCRTYFCDHAEAPYGGKPKLPRAAVAEVGRRIADLAARFDPRDPRPRPLVRAILDRA